IPQFSAKNEISTLAESIIRHVEKPVAINDYKLHMTTSVGISFYPEDGIRKHAIIESAHAALYRAKQLGKNNYQIYSFSQDISSRKKYMLEKDMLKAIENEEFELFYQPQVNPQNGVIESA